jgi:hypothetical protein
MIGYRKIQRSAGQQDYRHILVEMLHPCESQGRETILASIHLRSPKRAEHMNASDPIKAR